MPAIQYNNKKLKRGQLLWPAACMLINKVSDDACQWIFSWCSNLNRWNFFLKNSLYVARHTKKLWAFSDLVAAISAALDETFVRINTLTVFLSFWYVECGFYKDFVRQLKAFLTSFCHLCACEMSPGWGHLITWMDPSEGHLNGTLARVGGNLNNNFQKSQMAGGVPGGGGCWGFDCAVTDEQ